MKTIGVLIILTAILLSVPNKSDAAIGYRKGQSPRPSNTVEIAYDGEPHLFFGCSMDQIAKLILSDAALTCPKRFVQSYECSTGSDGATAVIVHACTSY